MCGGGGLRESCSMSTVLIVLISRLFGDVRPSMPWWSDLPEEYKPDALPRGSLPRICLGVE